MFSESYIKCHCTVQQHLVFCQGTKHNVFFLHSCVDENVLAAQICQNDRLWSWWFSVILIILPSSAVFHYFFLRSGCGRAALWGTRAKLVIWGWAERDQRQTVNFHSQSLSLPHVTLLSQHNVSPRFLTWHVGIVIYLCLLILVVYWIFNLCMLISCFYIYIIFAAV